MKMTLQEKMESEGMGKVVGTAYEMPTEREIKSDEFQTTSGRRVFLSRLQMSSTYQGCMEGGPESNSKYMREDLVERVRQTSGSEAVVVIDEGDASLPNLQWVAEFISGQGVKNDHPDFNSQLCVCWFSEGLPNDLKQFIQAALGRINWEASAEDYNILDF